LRNLGVGGRILLKLILEYNEVGWPVTSSCEHGNEPSVLIKGMEFPAVIYNWQLLPLFGDVWLWDYLLLLPNTWCSQIRRRYPSYSDKGVLCKGMQYPITLSLNQMRIPHQDDISSATSIRKVNYGIS
jgi:hypothetical protein